MRAYLSQKGFKKSLLDQPIAEEQERKKHKMLLLALISIIALVGIAILVMPQKCADIDCFVSQANECSSALLTRSVGGATLEFKTSHCLLTKKFISLPDEPGASVFKEADMSCPYEKGEFRLAWLRTTSSAGCTGKLAELFSGFA